MAEENTAVVRAAAETGGVTAVVLQLNSDGAVVGDERLDEVVEAIESSPVPIAVWVGPSGSKAEGDAARLVAAAEVSGLSPGSRIPAHLHRAGSEMHFVLEGDLVEAGQSLGPGAFLTHAAGQVHGPHESLGDHPAIAVQQAREFAHATQITGWMHHHAGGTLHNRLDDHRSDSRMVFVEQGFQLIDELCDSLLRLRVRRQLARIG